MSTGNTRLRLAGNQGNGVYTLIDCYQLTAGWRELENAYFVNYDFRIESITATIRLPSLDKAPLPSIRIDDTVAKKNEALREINENYPAMGLEFFIKNEGEAWNTADPECTIYLHNQGAEYYKPLLHPYLTYTEVYLMNRNQQLGCRIKNIGYGGMAPGLDSIILKATFNDNTQVIARIFEYITGTKEIGVDVVPEKQVVVPYRHNRASVWLQNSGEERIFLMWGDSPERLIIDSSPYLDPGMSAAYESPRFGFPQAIYACTAQGSSRLQGMEAW